MSLNTILFVVSLAFFLLIRKLQKLYDDAKEKHREEKLELILFCGRCFVRTGVVIRRCYMKMFTIFERKWFGLIFEGVQVIVMKDNCILICERDSTRKSLGTYDIGAGGMVSYPNSPRTTALEELDEELGLSCTSLITDRKLHYVKTFTPYDKMNCIIHVYETTIGNMNEINCKDGTYIDYKLINANSIINSDVFDGLKYDGKVIIKDLFI
jgi:hypothetical protein